MEGITHGVFNSRPFTTEDTLTLIIQALDSTMQPTATIYYYLAVDGTKNNGWVKVPLIALGKTSCLSFSMRTTDIGEFGSNTPLYFALDGLTINTEVPTSLPNSLIAPSPNSQKLIKNAQLMILRNGVWHDIFGNKLKQSL
jgi:hypothetical protein